jgi:hypothetical protein
MADGDPIIIGQANTASDPGDQTSLSRNEATNRTVLFARNLNVGGGIHGMASDFVSPGVQGTNTSAIGVFGVSTSSSGVVGISGSSSGVRGSSDRGDGVRGSSNTRYGVVGYTNSDDTSGMLGWSNRGDGVQGRSIGGTGDGVIGTCDRGPGVVGYTTSGIAVDGISESGTAVYGHRKDTYDPINAPNSVAGYFDGGIKVVNGPKAFQIDHPLDPQNKYLVHNAVESSEMKNVYDGVARLDEDGAAWVDLPEWFEALNGDFRYQLTAVGGSAPGLHVAEEVSENRFKIAGGEEGMKVCWQLTGSRKDPWAAANPFEVEQEKPEEERGRYLEPSLYDAPEEQRVMIGPMLEAVEEEQRPPEPSDIDLASLEEEHRREIDELSRQEEEHRREMEELRRRIEGQQEEAPPEST